MCTINHKFLVSPILRTKSTSNNVAVVYTHVLCSHNLNREGFRQHRDPFFLHAREFSRATPSCVNTVAICLQLGQHWSVGSGAKALLEPNTNVWYCSFIESVQQTGFDLMLVSCYSTLLFCPVHAVALIPTPSVYFLYEVQSIVGTSSACSALFQSPRQAHCRVYASLLETARGLYPTASAV